MTPNVTVQILTLIVSAIAAGGASYAALLAGRIQRKAAERQRMWEEDNAERTRLWQRLELDRIRGLDRLRSVYEAEVVAVARVEHLLWFAANRKIPVEALTEEYKEKVQALVRAHAADHSAVQLLGSRAVVEQADIVGRDISRAMWVPNKERLNNLSDSRAELIARMRSDLELEGAQYGKALMLYARPESTESQSVPDQPAKKRRRWREKKL